MAGNFVRTVQSNFSASRDRTLREGIICDIDCFALDDEQILVHFVLFKTSILSL